MQEIQELPLVLVNALDLHVEQRIDSDLHTGAPPHLLGQSLLVRALDAAEMPAELGIIRRPRQPSDLLQIVLPGGAQMLREQRRQPGVRLLQPAAHRDAVGHVDESIGADFGKTRKHASAHELGVQLRDTVDVMAADHGEMRHPHPPLAVLGDDRQAPLEIRIARPARRQILQEIAVDRVDDLEVPRQQALDQGDRPGLQRFGKQAYDWYRRTPAS